MQERKMEVSRFQTATVIELRFFMKKMKKKKKKMKNLEVSPSGK